MDAGKYKWVFLFGILILAGLGAALYFQYKTLKQMESINANTTLFGVASYLLVDGASKMFPAANIQGASIFATPAVMELVRKNASFLSQMYGASRQYAQAQGLVS
jgi:hypothetical protein